MRNPALVLLAAAALSSPAAAVAGEPAKAASDQAAQAAAETPVPAADPNRKICKRVNPTGYRLRATKLCATATEWELRTAEDRKATTELQTRLPKKAPGE